MKIKFSVCSDYHLNPQYPITADGLKTIIERAKENKVDAMLHCGDFVIDLKNQRNALDMFLHNDANIPAFGCYGNHELEQTATLEELNAAYGVKNSYYYLDLKGFRFVITDANFYEKDGEIFRYSGFSVGGPVGGYDHNRLGAEQLDWLKDTLLSSPYPCIILSHASLLGKPGSSRDSDKVRDIIGEVNKKTPKKVLMCLNGHHHSDSIDVLDNVVYFNINAVYMGGWKKEKHDKFPREFSEKYRSADNCAFFNDPLNAIVSVDSEGVIDIEGMETTYLYGVSAQDIGLPLHVAIGDLVPRISSAHIELD